MKTKIDSSESPYADIIELDRHISKNRSQMSLKDRAAQFAPFAAVVGHGGAVKEAARHTDERKELDETQKEFIDTILREIDAKLPSESLVKIVYFKADELKVGGKYISKIGVVDKIDKRTRELYMLDGGVILIDDIYSILINYS